MKIIFLDIDGVLNSGDNLAALHFTQKYNACQIHDKYGQLFDERCVRWLDFILMETNAKIVISSTWRIAGLNTMREMWFDRKLPGEIIGITPDSIDAALAEKFMETKADRGLEILEWLSNNLGVESYCIIDDNDDMTPEQLEHRFIHTSSKDGLDRTSAARAISILKINKPVC